MAKQERLKRGVMQYRKLGNTGIEVSEIGFGTWGLGGDSYGSVNDNVAKQTLKKAFELGVTCYDTSDLYGNGHSEVLLGDVFKNCRERVIIATKGGMLPHSGFYMPQDFSCKHLQKALEDSLKRIRTDYVDIYQLHSPTLADLENSDLIPFLHEQVRVGKIRTFGVSVRSPADGVVAIEKYGFPVIEVNFNKFENKL